MTILRHKFGNLVGLAAITMLYLAQALVGITWGLPSRSIDKYLFPDGEVWSGEKIYRLAGAGAKFDPSRGADVDADPLGKTGDVSIPLTASEQDVAKILLRYRLYTHQPDEMITMMALAGMKPGQLDLDPRLYQYGGLFIYPVGALIKVCGMLGLIDVRGDVAFYLDNPDEFGKFYVVARAYAAAWGLLGVLVVYAIARRAATPPTRGGATCYSPDAHRAALLAALLFTLMPVVVCMSHEGKPHLPGAVLMLIAVYFAMGCLYEPTVRRSFVWMCITCGAAVGMVLSSAPICILIPLVVIRAAGFSPRDRAVRMCFGTFLAIAVYLLSNPYILINAVTNREVLRSNFGNSLAMYEVSRIGEGFLRVLELTTEGATLPILVLGLIGIVVGLIRRNRALIPLLVVAAVFFFQFVLIGAGKPAEYGRFGVFTNTTLAILAATTLVKGGGGNFRRVVRIFGIAAITLWVGVGGASYLRGFQLDSTPVNSRTQVAAHLVRSLDAKTMVVLPREPAPYNCPPLPFARTRLFHSDSIELDPKNPITPIVRITPFDGGLASVLNVAMQGDPLRALRSLWRFTPISWANKPLAVQSQGG